MFNKDDFHVVTFCSNKKKSIKMENDPKKKKNENMESQ